MQLVLLVSVGVGLDTLALCRSAAAGSPAAVTTGGAQLFRRVTEGKRVLRRALLHPVHILYHTSEDATGPTWLLLTTTTAAATTTVAATTTRVRARARAGFTYVPSRVQHNDNIS